MQVCGTSVRAKRALHVCPLCRRSGCSGASQALMSVITFCSVWVPLQTSSSTAGRAVGQRKHASDGSKLVGVALCLGLAQRSHSRWRAPHLKATTQSVPLQPSAACVSVVSSHTCSGAGALV